MEKSSPPILGAIGWAKMKPHPGGDPRARTARWHKLEGEWVLLVSPLWNLCTGDRVSVPKRGQGRVLMSLGDYVGSLGPDKRSWVDCKEAFLPLGKASPLSKGPLITIKDRQPWKVENGRREMPSKTFGFAIVTVSEEWATDRQFEFGVVICSDCAPDFYKTFSSGFFVHSKQDRLDEIKGRCEDQLAGPFCVRCGDPAPVR